MTFAVTNIEQDQISDYPSFLVHGEYVDSGNQDGALTDPGDVGIQDLLIFLQNSLGTNRITQPRLIQWLSSYAFENIQNFDFPSTNSPDDYYSILSSILLPRGFERTEMYIDQFNGHVVDFFSDEERITCIVSAEEIQILSFLKGEFGERMFERTKQTKTELDVYVIDLFDNPNQ